jgi:septal ring factor EnvC (AmiA/AmiB activator)
MAEKSCNNCGKESCDERCTSNTIRCTAWTPKKPEKVYLDKEAVLNALKSAPNYITLRCCINRGEFDAPLIPPEYWRTCMAEKDAEIAALQKRCEDDRDLAATHVKMIDKKNAEIARLKHQLKIESEASGLVIRTAYDQITNLVSTVSLLEDRIVDLEKLCDMQKATIDAQDKRGDRFSSMLGDHDQKIKDLETALKALQEEVNKIPRYVGQGVYVIK